MALLASDLMDQSAIILNDSGKNLFTYSVQIPYLAKANERLEQILLENDVEVERKQSTDIAVAALAKTLTLPADFLIPIELFERDSTSTSENDWQRISEKMWDDNAQPGNILGQWAFYNNAINFIGCTADRAVRLRYERMLGVISTQNSTYEVEMFKPFLSAKTAEYCARYIGMNKILADEIKMNECDVAQETLERILVQASQGLRFRRRPFTVKNSNLIRTH